MATRRAGGGRKPQPTALKILKGNPSGKPLKKNEPKPLRCISSAPHWVSPEAATYWDKIEPMLFRIGVLTEADELMLGILCQSYANLLKAREMIEKHGPVIKTPNGSIQISPFKSLERQAFADIMKVCQEFGMSPSSRARLTATPPTSDPGDPFDDL
jgi:P27 family predicted phage terminase small subunit